MSEENKNLFYISFKSTKQTEALIKMLEPLGWTPYSGATKNYLQIGLYKNSNDELRNKKIGGDNTSREQKSLADFFAFIAGNEEVTLKLNNEHSALITKDTVKVGCQEFTADKVLELAEEIKKLRKE